MNYSTEQATTFCVHDDRPNCLVGVKLAVLSLLHHCPDLPVVISCPSPPASLCTWAESLDNVTLVSYPELEKNGWNVKPTVLLRLLEAGYSEVVWVDSDIIVTSDITSKLLRHSDDVPVVTQETYWGQQQGGTSRTVAWGFTPGQTLPCTINTGVVRVTTQHTELLKAWQTMLNHPVYVKAQSLPWYERPLHMVSDQDALTALMGSVEFSSTPVVMLKRGIDIAQCFGPSGFTPMERLRSLSNGLPALVHAMRLKPWRRSPKPPNVWNPRKPLLKRLREYYNYLEHELSPYTSAARQYREVLEEDTAWMNVESNPGKLMSALTGNNPILQGFLLSVFDAALMRKWLTSTNYSTNPEFFLKESPLS